LYDEIVTELTTKQQELNDRLIALTDSNKSFMVTTSYLLDLAQKASELFKNSSERLQQKLLKFVLSNVELSDKKLSYTVNNPYKTFIDLNKKALAEPKSANWCNICDALQTSALEQFGNQKLIYLAKVFNLSDSLV